MARAVNRLTARQVQTISQPGRHADGGGLYLIVDKTGAKRWGMLVTVRGRRRELGLGSIRNLTLAEAREAALEASRAISRGEDPKRSAAPSPRFAEAAQLIIDELAPGWTGRDTKAHWERSLLIYAADMGDIPVDLIGTDDVIGVVKPLWRTRPESGRKLRQRIETVLDTCAVKGWREGANPARLKGHLDKLLPKQPRTVVHRRAISYEAAPAALVKIGAHTAMSARAMEWTIFTAAREGMTTGATWGEIEEIGWRVPGHRMKGDDAPDFIVPLSIQARQVLDAVRIGAPDPDAYIFPGAKKGRPMSNQTMDKLLATLGIDATPHGWRSTFSDWVADETDHPREVREAALAHVISSDTERAYRRKNALRKRGDLMQDWADYLRPRPAPEAEEAPPEESASGRRSSPT